MPPEKDSSSSSSKSNSIWTRWTPVIYKFSWGYSVTRGCTFAWFFLTIPYYCFLYLRKLACKFVYNLCCSPKGNGCWSYTVMYISWIPTIILAIIWLIITIILLIPWFICYILGFIIECIIMIIYGISCCYYCCSNNITKQTYWRSFSFSGWITEWTTGYDPYTEEVWNQWSPIRTLCDYNIPPV